MNGWKSSFIQLPPLLSVPTLPPSTPLQCRTPSPPTHTHINTHSLPCPLRNTGRGGCVWVGFPNYLSRFQQMVKELSSWGSRCSFPLSQRTWLLHFSPFPFPKDSGASSFSSPDHLKKTFERPNWNLKFCPDPQTFSLSSQLPKDQTVHLASFSSDPETFCPPQRSSTVGSDIQLLHPARTVEQIMPSDFLTPFLELDEEFCKVRASFIT